jgi:hypothetical protein
MATMVSIKVWQNGGIIYARKEWLHSGELLLSGRLEKKEVDEALKALIATASKRRNCPACQSEIGDDLKSRWADIMHLMTSGFLMPKQVKETLRDLNALGRYLPVPERVRIKRLKEEEHFSTGGTNNAGARVCIRGEVG